MIKRFTIFCLFTLLSDLYAQQDPQIAHRLQNVAMYNPAAAGANQMFDVALLARQQWVGIDGAPTVLNLNASQYFSAISSGVGINVVNSTRSNNNNLNLTANYSFQARVNDDAALRFGIGGGMYYMHQGENTFLEDDDPYFYQEKTTVLPDLNLGIEYDGQILRLGIAVDHLFKFKEDVYAPDRHYYAYGQLAIPVLEEWELIPGAMAVFSPVKNQVDMSALVRWNKQIWVGFGYRTEDAYSVFVGAKFMDMWTVSYAYDFRMDNTASNFSSHELMLTLQMDWFRENTYLQQGSSLRRKYDW